MECERIEDLLSPYLEDELTPEERNAVETHLSVCQSCSELLSFMRKTKEDLAQFPELDVSDHLLSRLSSIPAQKKRFRLRWDFVLRPSLQPILAAATVLIVMVSLYFFTPYRENINQSVDRKVHRGYSKIERLVAEAESFTSSLGAYKDEILVSFKRVNPFGGNEE
ncbi:MAG: anti-sigma factor family protein [Candidatus Aminicenantales bacterium]